MRLLLVEDEPALREPLREGLAEAGYAVEVADNGRDALHLGLHEAFDAVVLDLGLPQLDGLSVLRRWSEAGRNTPVLILTAQGLASPLLRHGALVLDTRSSRVSVDGQPVVLTAHEFRLLAYLMHRPGAVVSRSELTEHLYAQDFDRDSNTIEVFVGRLRRKLPPDSIETVRGLGYRLGAPAAAP